MKPRYGTVGLLVLGSLGLVGCPELQPSFDATGDYIGEYSVGLGDFELISGCGMQLTLEQDITGLPILNAKVEGAATLSLDCVVPEDLAGLLGGDLGAFSGILGALGTGGLPEGLSGLLTIPPMEVTGVLLPDGTLELSSPDLLEECTEGDCTKVAMVGKGSDSDGDGLMDGFEGTFVATLGSDLGGLPIIGNFEVHTGS